MPMPKPPKPLGPPHSELHPEELLEPKEFGPSKPLKPKPGPSGPGHPKPPKPHGPPPRERVKKTRPKRISLSLIIGTAVAFVIGLALHLFQIPLTVILPVLAPIWIGTTTLAYMELSQH